ncbi:universal stress protein [Natronococcus jeotgali]|uniref:universal stress protein n=1 Tax=Natronococcus jeotgali TaxID=413812 RepID=UPI0012688F1E|nr:universal stress protein [Natronococcus jeotgali]
MLAVLICLFGHYRKRLLGGVTEGVIYQGDLPVLVVPSFDQPIETDIGYSRLLFPTDGSKNSDIAIEHVIEIAKHFDAVIHVVNVVDLQAAGGVFNAGGLENTFVKRLETAGKNVLDSVEAEITETTPELDVEPVVVHTSSFEGVAAGIREYVSEHDFDLIVMGSHGRSNIKRQLIGSVASTVLRTVDIPVLVIKRPAQQAQ